MYLLRHELVNNGLRCQCRRELVEVSVSNWLFMDLINRLAVDFSALIVSGYEQAPKPAPAKREWMEETDYRFAYRCLPMTIANQAGWVIESQRTFAVYWNGSNVPGSCLEFEFDSSESGLLPSDHFGWGIVTFHIPFLFRTEPGVGLLVRGLPNYFKANVHPLEGYVETDWSPATFTMNWKVAEPKRIVVFEKGDPICFIQPFSVDLLEQQKPRMVTGSSEPHELDEYVEWASSRQDFLSDLPDKEGAPWQKDYFKGKNAHKHRTRLHLQNFEHQNNSTTNEAEVPT